MKGGGEKGRKTSSPNVRDALTPMGLPLRKGRRGVGRGGEGEKGRPSGLPLHIISDYATASAIWFVNHW